MRYPRAVPPVDSSPSDPTAAAPASARPADAGDPAARDAHASGAPAAASSGRSAAFFTSPRSVAVRRLVLSASVLNGFAAALGMLLISSLVHARIDAFAASVAGSGIIACLAADLPAPRRGKIWDLLPGPLLGLPLFMAVQLLHDRPVLLGLLLVPASFLAFLAGAWGRRGLPIVVSIMLSMVFSMAVPPQADPDGVLLRGVWFALGAGLYLLWGLAINAALNPRYRVLYLAETLLATAALTRTQARRFDPSVTIAADAHSGVLLRQQAALADQLQAARNLLLESPRTERRRRLAGMLVRVIEIRDHLLACELDLDAVHGHPAQAVRLAHLRATMDTLALRLETLADALMLGRTPAPVADLRPMLIAVSRAQAHVAATQAADGPDTDRPALPVEADRAAAAGPATRASDAAADRLAAGLANRVGHIADETRALVELARGEREPDVAVVRSAWKTFVSPTSWSWAPLLDVLRWDAPPLRHAIRAALAIGSAYALSLALPWGTHDYWILLTIVVVLRGSLAQTLERRNARVAGTLLGCVLASGLLWTHQPGWVLLLLVPFAQGVAHAFAVRKYVVTAVAATVLGLLQAHLLAAGPSPAFELIERLADTMIGAAVAWIFSYVLPSWERGQLPALVTRTLDAQARHARRALALGQLDAIDDEPELAWRLARREAFDSLSALTQAAQRALAEPRAVRPPMPELERLQTQAYQLLAQLTAIKTMLVVNRGRLGAERLREPLRRTGTVIDAMLTGRAPDGTVASAQAPGAEADDPSTLTDPLRGDVTPWALRRLALAISLAAALRADADRVLVSCAAPASGP